MSIWWSSWYTVFSIHCWYIHTYYMYNYHCQCLIILRTRNDPSIILANSFKLWTPSMPLDIICDLFYAKSSPVSLRRRGQAKFSYHRSYIKKKKLLVFWIKKCLLGIFTSEVTNIIGKVTFIHWWVAILNSMCVRNPPRMCTIMFSLSKINPVERKNLPAFSYPTICDSDVRIICRHLMCGTFISGKWEHRGLRKWQEWLCADQMSLL